METKLALVCIDKGTPLPPLGLAYISSYLKKEGFQAKIFDINFCNIIEEITRYNPNIVGISAMTIRYNHAVNLARILKEKTKAKILIGGSHISTNPNSLSKYFDIGVLGEGEETVLEVMKLFEKEKAFPKKKLARIKGLVYYDGEKIRTTKKRELIMPLDKIPEPDLKALNNFYFSKRENSYFGEKIRAGYIFTARGCPYRCVFCSTSLFWERVRFHSLERIMSEIKNFYYNYHVQSIAILDDLFPVSKEQIRSLISELKRENLLGKIKFSCQPRANLVDEELCKLMKELGVVSVLMGFESGSEKILNYLKAGSVKVKDNIRAVSLLKKYNFVVMGGIMLGNPKETMEDIKDTIKFVDFLMSKKVDVIWIYKTTPYPGTKLWDYQKELGNVKDDMNWDLFALENVNQLVFIDNTISLKEFQEIFKKLDNKVQVYMRYLKFKKMSIREKIITLFNPKKIIGFLKKLSGI